MSDPSALPHDGFLSNILTHLGRDGGDDEYVLFFHEPQFSQVSLPDNGFQKVLVRPGVGSLSAQISFAWSLYKAKLDCVYFPHFHVPFLYIRPYIITVSDLRDLFYPDKNTAKGLGRYMYRFLLTHAVRYAKRIIVWSQYTARDIVETFNISETKIVVITPSIGGGRKENIQEETKRYLTKQGIEKPYILFVGDIREYKNLPRCIRAYSEIVAEGVDIDFVIIGRELPTYHEVRNTIIELSLQSRVHVLGHIAPEKLPFFYEGAKVYILPSIYEGSGFPLLSAIEYDLPIICSNIPSLSEVVDETRATFFRPLSAENIRESLSQILSDMTLSDRLKGKGSQKSAKGVWDPIEKIIQTCQKTPKGKGK